MTLYNRARPGWHDRRGDAGPTSGTDPTKFVPKTITITAANATPAVGDPLEWVSTATGPAPQRWGRVIVQQSHTY